jgi:hypothetical protein
MKNKDKKKLARLVVSLLSGIAMGTFVYTGAVHDREVKSTLAGLLTTAIVFALLRGDKGKRPPRNHSGQTGFTGGDLIQNQWIDDN